MLLDVIKKYSNVIENKDTDGASLRRKNDTWTEITGEYNASPHATCQVTMKQLRRLWMNLKQRQREALTKERQHRMATGGGPSTSDAILDPDVSEVAPALIVGIDSAIDSDAVSVMVTEETNFVVEPTETEIPTFYEVEEQPPSQIQENTPDIPTETFSSQLQPIPPTMTHQRQKNVIIEKEYKDRQMRANQKHDLEMVILKEQLREAKAKADLAVLILRQQQNVTDTITQD